MSNNLYEDLGVATDASPEQIKAAGKRMAKKHHPDAGGDPEGRCYTSRTRLNGWYGEAAS